MKSDKQFIGDDENINLPVIPGTRPEIIKMSPVIRECERRGMDYFKLAEEEKKDTGRLWGRLSEK